MVDTKSSSTGLASGNWYPPIRLTGTLKPDPTPRFRALEASDFFKFLDAFRDGPLSGYGMPIAVGGLPASVVAVAAGPASLTLNELFAATLTLAAPLNYTAINNEGGLIFTFRCRIRHGVGLLSGGSATSALARPHRRAFSFRKVAVHVCEKPGNNPSSLATSCHFLRPSMSSFTRLRGNRPPIAR